MAKDKINNAAFFKWDRKHLTNVILSTILIGIGVSQSIVPYLFNDNNVSQVGIVILIIGVILYASSEVCFHLRLIYNKLNDRSA